RGSSDTYGELSDSTLTVLAADNNSGEDYNFRMVNQLSPGTYYIRISGYGFTTTGSYQLHVEGPGAGTVSDDHGLSPWSATPVTAGSVTSGSINVGDDVDYFKFTATVPTRHSFALRGSSDTYGELSDSTLTLLATDNNSGEDY